MCCCPEIRLPVRGPSRARHGAEKVLALSERLPECPGQAKGHSVGEGWAAWLEALCGSGSPAVAGRVGLAPKMALAASETPLQCKKIRKGIHIKSCVTKKSGCSVKIIRINSFNCFKTCLYMLFV